MGISTLSSCLAPAECRITDNPLVTTSTDPAAEVSIKTDKHMVSFKKMVTNEATIQTNQWDLMQDIDLRETCEEELEDGDTSSGDQWHILVNPHNPHISGQYS